jgi:acyl dehydratase
MAFSAVIGDRSPAAYDTSLPDGCAVHPLFAVAVEWALMTARPDPFGLGLSPDDEHAGIHTTHDLRVQRAWSAPRAVTVRGHVTALRQVRSGVHVTFRFAASDRSTGDALWSTEKGMIYLGATLDGAAVADSDRWDRPSGEASGEPIELSWTADAGFAHTYTECARIWNPIHTDVRAAREAGLTEPILHGTATLARTVSALVTHLRADPARLLSVGGEFRAMVPLPALVQVQFRQLARAHDTLVQFDAFNESGGHAVRHGYLTFT